VSANNATCNPAEIAHVELEMARNPANMGVGVIDKRTGQMRLFSFDETDAFSRANCHLGVSAGHEAAATMAGIPVDQARGFIIAKQANIWHVFNQSHLNRPDAQSNTMRMDGQLFSEIMSALQVAGLQSPIIH
jgi:hypothetical protein